MSRYFRFGLRTILILTTIAAVLFAWLGRDIVRARSEKPIIDRIISASGQILFEGDAVPPTGNFSTDRWKKPNFLQRQFGVHYGAYVEAVSLIVGSGNPTDETIQGLGRFERLQKVTLVGRGFTDKCVDDLLQVGHLKDLALIDTSISAAGVKRLAKCSELETLMLCDDRLRPLTDGGPSELSNAHLEALSEFPSLLSLTIAGKSLTDEGFSHVGKCAQLTQLRIVRTGVTDDAFEHLTNLQQLQSLDISNVVVRDKSMRAIGELRQLKKLRLYSTAITDEGLVNLKNLSQLRELTLYRCTINGRGFSAISSLKNLQRLCITSSELNDDGISAIGCLPGLMELEISESKVTGRGLQQLQHATKLRLFSFRLTSELRLDDAKDLKAKLPNCQIDWVEIDPSFGSGSL